MASKLPDAFTASWADTTAWKCIGTIRQWKDWAAQHGMHAIPTKDFGFALYQQHLADTSRSKAAVDEACYALAWIHATAGLTSPTNFSFLGATKEGLQKSLAKPIVQKSSFTVEMLVAVVEDTQHSGALADLRLATACLLAFARFLHFNELVALRPCDVTVQKDLGYCT